MNIFQKINEKEYAPIGTRLVLFATLINILVLVIVVFFIVIIGKTLQGEDKVPSQISVSGEGKVFIRPDIAMFMVTVVTDAPRVADAQNQNSTRANAVIGFLKKKSIQEKDIKTLHYSVEPQYRYDSGQPCPVTLPSSAPCFLTNGLPRIISYKVRSSLEVKVRDLNKVDDLLQGVVSAGANEIGSVTFTVEDEKAATVEARKKAIEDAQQKAGVLARDLGVRIKKIIGFSESGGGPIYYARALESSSMGGKIAPAPLVEPGEQEIQSNVTITYEFR